MVAAEEWAQCTNLFSHGNHGRVLLAQNRFLRIRKLLLVVDQGRTVGSSGHCGDARRMGDFLARNQRNQESPIARSVYLAHKNRMIVVRTDCETNWGKWGVRLNKILFGSP